MTTLAPRWRWTALVVGLVVLALGLAWVDSVLVGHFNNPLEPAAAAGPIPPLPEPGGRLRATRVFGTVGGIFSFWWFLCIVLGVLAVTVLVVVALPGRVRTAIEGVESSGGPLLALVAGVASLLLLGAFSLVVRLSVVLLPLLGVIWAVGALGVIFGTATLALFVGGLLRRRLGDIHPVTAAFTGLLLLADLALLPYAGIAALAVLGVTSLGVAVMTRFGSARGWSLDELEW